MDLKNINWEKFLRLKEEQVSVASFTPLKVNTFV